MKITATRGRLIVSTLLICGIFALAGGCVLLGFFDRIINFFLKKELILKPGHEFYEIYKNIPIPIYQKIYIFNITNPSEFTEGAKPILDELGPYVFKGQWLKEEIIHDDEDGTVQYRDVKNYEFVPELSVGTQEDMIFTLNAPLLGVVNFVEELAPVYFRAFVIDIMNGIFESYNESLLVNVSVREIIYEGYHVPMVGDLVKVIEPFFDLPLQLINDTFGILHEKKHIGDGVFSVKSGVKGLRDYSHIVTWNNKSELNWWDGETCNQISGATDGIQYAPGISRNETLVFFNPNLCRSIPLKYAQDITVHGIKTYRFSMPSNVFATADENPDNECFNIRESGILPLNCKKGAPFVISLPHFFEGDPKLSEGVVGVSASSKLHKSFVDIEPITGFVLNAAVKIQLNGVVHNFPEYNVLQSVGDHIVPVVWMSEEATLDVFFANYFKSRVQTPILVFKVICISSAVIGAIWVMSSIVFLFCIEAKVKPDTLKHSVVLKTLNSVYTSVALWPPEEETKDGNDSEKTHL